MILMRVCLLMLISSLPGCAVVAGCSFSVSLIVDDVALDDHVTPVLLGVGGVEVFAECEVIQ